MNSPVLVLNAGSSSLKFAVFHTRPVLRRIHAGKIERVRDHAAALEKVWAEAQPHAGAGVSAVAHRIVHGGPTYFEPQTVTTQLIDELRRLSPFDPEHLPPEIGLIEAMRKRDSVVRQIACFDTAFHHSLPRVARLLPLPRRYESAGVRRYGFHGLSYQFLLGELQRLGDRAATQGRVILAHLGHGASLAAIRDGRCVDTSMAFTPTSGLVMGTRSGDLDPGLVAYLAATEGMTVAGFQKLVNRESGLLGLSGLSGDMRELLAREADDARAAEAIAVFCHQARKWIGGYAAVLGGVDTLVFAGGIGENCPSIRARICAGFEFIGLALDAARNAANAPVISAERSPLTVRMLHTDEETVIARAAAALLDQSAPQPGDQR